MPSPNNIYKGLMKMMTFFNLTKTMADLTVKISVYETSGNRPEFYPQTKDPYPFYNQNYIRHGTGRVEDVKEIFGKPCRCALCETSPAPRYSFWEVKIFTATHVVFDDTEARHTVCRLKYDSDSSICVTLNGLEVTESDVQGDWCCFKCATHDTGLAVELMESLEQCATISRTLAETFPRAADQDNLVIIVAHPHGGPKMVSVGVWTSRREMEWPDETNYTYTTTTCPGSSGAWVYVLGRVGSCGLSYHVHSGCKMEGNFCSVGWDF